MRSENEAESREDTETGREEGNHALAETRRLMELVRFLARTLEVNNSALARNANVPLATLVRYFRGEGEPKLEFLLSMVQSLGLEVREFFELAYPTPPSRTPARARIDQLLLRFQPGPHPPIQPAAPRAEPPRIETAPLQREDIEQMMDQLRRDVREMLGERTPAAAPEQPAAPRKTRKG